MTKNEEHLRSYGTLPKEPAHTFSESQGKREKNIKFI